MNSQNTIEVSTNTVPIIDLPWLFRIICLQKSALPKGGFRYCATLFHEKVSIAVTWLSSKEDDRLQAGSLITPRWTSKVICMHGQVVVNRVLPVSSPGLINLFDTVPYEWMNDRTVLHEASAIVNMLPDHFIRLINAIFLEHRRFYRFITGPSSLNGHHNWKHGNFIHTIEVAKNALKLCEDRPMVSLPVLITAALLHDAAKADEYSFNIERNRFEISTRGALIGHKMTIIEWIAAAIAQHQIDIPKNEYLGLIHALTAVKGAPDWIGLREPVSLECNLLSMADRLSGQDDLFDQVKPHDSGFGRFHKHLRGRGFVIQNKLSAN